jgi:hypothetical protein
MPVKIAPVQMWLCGTVALFVCFVFVVFFMTIRAGSEASSHVVTSQLAHYVFTTLQFGCCLVRSLSYVKITLPQRILDT